MKPPRTPLPDRGVFAGVLLMLAWLPLPWGSHTPATTALLGAGVALLAVARLLLAGKAPPPALPRAARAALALWAAWLGWLGLQLLPLPRALLAMLSPAAADAQAALDGVAEAPALFTLSLAPGTTLEQWLLSASYAAWFWLILVSVARNRERQKLLLATLVLSGTLQALYGTIMTLSHLEYGFFEPKAFGLGVPTGTFVNRNHFAGYLELTLAAGVGLILADFRVVPVFGWRDRLARLVDLALSARLRTRVTLVVMVIALVLTRSRGGNVAFFTALAGCGALYLFLRHRKYFAKGLLFFASLFVVDLLIVSQQYGLHELASRLESTELQSEQRMIAFHDVAPLLSVYAGTGSGAGTFADAFSPYRSDDLRGFYDHAHNDHLEFLIEVGVPGYALLAALALLVLGHSALLVWRRRDPVPAALGFAGAMALVALLIHGAFDFNLRIPAVAATLVAMMALPLSCSTRSRRRAEAAPPGAPGDAAP